MIMELINGIKAIVMIEYAVAFFKVCLACFENPWVRALRGVHPARG